MNEKLERFRVLDGTMLKLIALVSMTFDHVGDIFFPQQTWMRVIGRLAMPIFAFCIAEGYIHTRDPQKYLMRLGLFALISEVPFDLASSLHVSLEHQNIMFTFFLGVLSLMLFDQIEARWEGTKGFVLGTIVVAVIAVGSVFLRVDYNFTAIGLIFLFYVLADKGPLIRYSAAIGFHALVRNEGVYRWGILGIILLALYNGRRGRGLKQLFYFYYPGHLLVLYLLRLILKV